MGTLAAGPLLGHAMRRWQTGGLTLTESVYGHEVRLRRHAHERPHFCVVLDGRYDEVGRHGTEPRLPGSVVYLPALCPHAERHHTEGRHFIVELDEMFVARMADDGLGLPADHTAIAGAEILGIVWRLRDELRRGARASSIALEALSLELVAGAARTSRRRRVDQDCDWLRKVDDILKARFAEPMSLRRIAGEIGRHPTHLARAFRARTGESLGHALRRVRLEAAAVALVSSNRSIAEIAVGVGFSDHSHLTRLFTRRMGVSPSRFRRDGQLTRR